MAASLSSRGPEGPYRIPGHLTWMDPKNRKLRVLTIGAGISGILMAYRIQKDCENVEHVVYERNSDIGGESGHQFWTSLV